MCDLLLRALALGALLVLPAAAPVASQQAAEAGRAVEVERIPAVLDSLTALLADLQDRARARSRELGALDPSEEAVLSRLQELEVGPLRILSLPEDTAVAREIFSEAWSGLREMASEAPAPFDEARFLFVGRGRSVPGMAEEEEGSVRRVDPGAWYTRSRALSVARRAVGDVLASQFSDRLRRWTGNLPLRPDPELASVHRELVSTPSRATRECYAVGGSWCWEALGITDASRPAERWARWYDDAELRRTARSLEPRTVEQRRLLNACLASSDAAPCAGYLGARRGHPRPPLSAHARSSILVLAVIRGGSGSIDALATGDDVRTILADAAGTTPDVLVDAWRESVRAARPENDRAHPGVVAGTLIWILVFGGIASRSSRWDRT